MQVRKMGSGEKELICKHSSVKIGHQYNESICLCSRCGKLLDFLNLQVHRKRFEEKNLPKTIGVSRRN